MKPTPEAAIKALQEEVAALRQERMALQRSRRLWRESFLGLRAKLKDEWVFHLPHDPLPDHLVDEPELSDRQRARQRAAEAAEAERQALVEGSRQWQAEMAELIGN